jgi:hypothetical protein
VTFTSYGYDGSLSETGWAVLAQHLGVDQCVFGAADFATTIGGSGDRALTVAAGTAAGHGVADVSNATVNLNGGAVGSGTRWDTVALRRSWSGTGGTSSVVLVAGGSSKALAAGLNVTPGTLADQPLALARFIAGSTAAQEVQDLRGWAGKVRSYPDKNALPASAPYGSMAITIDDGAFWHRLLVASVLTWVPISSSQWIPMSLSGGFTPSGYLSGIQTPQYRRVLGSTELSGSIELSTGAAFGAGTNGVVIATLPAGFRPTRTVPFAVAASRTDESVAARVEINSAGEIRSFVPVAYAHLWIAFNGVRFPATDATITGGV